MWEIALVGGSLVTISLAGGLLGVTVAGVTENRALSSVLQLAIVGSEDADTFELGPGVPELTVPINIDGRGGADRIRGPPTTSRGQLPASTRRLSDSSPSRGIEQLEGGADNEDTFVVLAGGTISSVDGGTGGYDTLVVNGNGTGEISSVSIDRSSGTITVDGRTIEYTGLEPVLINSGSAASAVFTLTPSADTAVLEDAGGGQLRLRSTAAVPTFEDTTFTAPTTSLTINLGAGADHLTVAGLGSFAGLLIIITAAMETTRSPAPPAVRRGRSTTTARARSTAPTSRNSRTSSAATGTTTSRSSAAVPSTGLLDGGDGDDTLTGPDVDTGWELTGADEGAIDTVAFTGVENLTGGSAADAFAFAVDLDGAPTGSLTGSIDGGGGSDALVAPDTTNDWAITGQNLGTLTFDVGGTDVPVAFTSIENLIGGSGDDSFVFGTAGKVDGLVDGGPADADADPQPVDTLDYTAWSSPVGVQLTGGAAALTYTFSTQTGDTDPGVGTLRLGSAIQNTALVIRADAQDTDAVDIAALLDAFDDPSGMTKGTIRIVDPNDDTKWLVFAVSAVTVPGGGGYRNLTVSILDSSAASPFVDGDKVTLLFSPAASTASGVGSFDNIDKFVGGSGDDSLAGPSNRFLVWTISGADKGDVGGILFDGFENLIGAADNNDVFVVKVTDASTGSISGSVAGGLGGRDGLVIYETTTSGSLINPAGADSFGTVTQFGKTVAYTGLDHQDVIGGNDVKRKVSGSFFDDTIVLSDADPNSLGQLKVRFEGTGWYDVATGSTTREFIFANPTESLVIEGKEGTDTIRIESLDPGFNAYLGIFGNAVTETLPNVNIDDPYVDTVTFTGDIDTGDGTLEVWADKISVDDHKSISVGDGFITFRARIFGIATLENLTPIAFGSNREVSIVIGEGAKLEGTGIYLIAQAEDKSLADVLGAQQGVATTS